VEGGRESHSGENSAGARRLGTPIVNYIRH
jgi:hypothetical protein